MMMQKVGLGLVKEQTKQLEKQEELGEREKTEKKEEGIIIENASVPMSIENNSHFSQDSNESSHSNHWQDKYPPMPPRSPKFDQGQLLSAISLKQQFMSSKHDKMSELVKTMFEKRLVSPRSFESQMKFLKEKYDEDNMMLESYRKQAEQLSSLLSEIKKDKEQIQGIDELIRNEKWEQAQKLVHKSEDKNKDEMKQMCEAKLAVIQEEEKHEGFELGGWEKEEGWERVNIPSNEVQNNEFVDLDEM